MAQAETPPAASQAGSPAKLADTGPAARTGNGSINGRSAVKLDIDGAFELDKNGEFQIYGEVKGNLAGTALNINKSGSMRGDVRARKVSIEGAFAGTIETDNLTIGKTAKVDGDFVVNQTVVIEPGAQFKGTCRRAG